MSNKLFFLLFVACVLSLSNSAFAEQSSISGVVRDSDDAVVADAEVVLLNAQQSVIASARTDQSDLESHLLPLLQVDYLVGLGALISGLNDAHVKPSVHPIRAGLSSLPNTGYEMSHLDVEPLTLRRFIRRWEA